MSKSLKRLLSEVRSSQMMHIKNQGKRFVIIPIGVTRRAGAQLVPYPVRDVEMMSGTGRVERSLVSVCNFHGGIIKCERSRQE